DATAAGARLQAFPREQDAGSCQLLVEPTHLRQDRLVGQRTRLGRLGSLDDRHHSHQPASSTVVSRAPGPSRPARSGSYSRVEQGSAEIDMADGAAAGNAGGPAGRI